MLSILYHIFQYGFAALLCLMFLGLFLGWVLAKIDERRNARRGWRVETLGPGQLRGGEDDWAVFYHEGDLFHFFSGSINRASGQVSVSVPDAARWEAEMPEWLRGRRDVVLARIRQEAKRVQIVTEPAQS